MTHLADIHLSWGLASDEQISWLMDEGVSDDALMHDYPVGSANVIFDRNTFDIDPDGECALTFRALDRGEIIDLIAWSPESNRIGSWRGVAFAVGDQDDIWNPASFFDGSPLRVHANPLAWLKADREGIVVVDHRMTNAMLGRAWAVSFADYEFAEQFQKWVQPPAPTVRLFIEGISDAE
jgi:hypothetical protein